MVDCDNRYFFLAISYRCNKIRYIRLKMLKIMFENLVKLKNKKG